MMDRRFAKQLQRARRPDGSIDIERLQEQVVQAYEEAEQDRLRTDRSIGLMVEELSALQEGLKSKIASRTAALRKSRQALRLQNSRFSAALEHMVQGLSLFDQDQRLVICNRQYLDLYGLPRRCARAGTTYEKILRERIRANSWVGTDPEEYVSGRVTAAKAAEPLTRVYRLNNGRVITVNHQPLPGGGWVSTHMDVTEIHRLQDDLAHLAYFDALTGLPNRNMLLQRLAEGLAAPEAELTLMFLDLDGFKTVNDTLGHGTGDRLLQEVGRRLSSCMGIGQIVGRLGGDEFAMLLPGRQDAAAARELAEAVDRALRRPIEIASQPLQVRASIGVALAPRDGTDAEELLRNADLALYAAKRDGRGSYRFFEPVMKAGLQDRRQMEQELSLALERGEFELHYQPVLNLAMQRFSGFEALLRWRHPERGLVSPASFVPLAEELGLIVPIGEWAIREAFAEAARWPSDLRVAVNVSSIQFERGNLLPVVVNALASSGLAAHRVEVEITESIFLANSEKNLEVLHQLHMLGVRIALDDFGTGYSALSYLLRFPFNKIKVDGSFVQALEKTDGAVAILRAVSDIAGGMGITTTAEGVESAEQLRMVNALGYNEVQGYLVSRPMPAEDLHRLISQGDRMPEAPLLRRLAG